MKKLLILFFVINLQLGIVLGQEKEKKNSFSIFPLGFINKAKFSYERTILQPLNLGIMISGYYNINITRHRGLKVEPLLRYYPFKRQLGGFYIKMKIGYGYFYTDQKVYVTHHIYDQGSSIPEPCFSHYNADNFFHTYGGGIAIGYRSSIGQLKRFFLDLEVGFQFYYKEMHEKTYEFIDQEGRKVVVIESYEDPLAEGIWWNWYKIGPGAYFNPCFSIGYFFPP